MRRPAGLAAGLALMAQMAMATGAPALDLDRAEGSLRVASFNAALSRQGAGLLLADIAKRDAQVLAVAEVILRVRPDILLLNEFDHDPGGRALAAFTALLAEGVGGVDGLDYPFLYHGPSNTGVPSGFDLDGDGRAAGPRDAFGYGRFPGQYGMALLSRLPVEFDAVRSFRLFRWADLPQASRPMLEDGSPYHDDDAWAALRLSSKSHWQVPVRLARGGVLHLLAAHPTPPAFDGPEDLNGRRNADEIRLIAGLIDGAEWLVDDAGGGGGLAPDARFVVLGDLNAAPHDGDSRPEGIAALLGHPRISDPHPTAPGGAAAVGDGPNASHSGPAAEDTADFREAGGPGNLRVDYVLPSAGLEVTGAGVFWPAPDDPLARLTGNGGEVVSSDHRLVWVDIRP